MNFSTMSAREIASTLVSSLVLASDPSCQAASPDWWLWTAPRHEEVAKELAGSPHADVRALVAAVQAAPADVAACLRLENLLTDRLTADGADARDSPLADLVRKVERESRVRLHLGADASDEAPGTTPEEIFEALARAGAEAGPARTSRGGADAVIVIPFRDVSGTGPRLRNLAATIAALRDQSYDRDRYRVVVVEADEHPRWRSTIADHVDEYVFLEHSGLFNKSWMVNVGVRRAARDAELLCILDGDILVDHDYVERAVDRLDEPGTQAHWPFKDMLYLDGPSSARAIRARCRDGVKKLDAATLRGVSVRRPPGGCLWLRTGLFRRTGGMDERFAGWGGEDVDFAWRADRRGPVDRFDDLVVHLDHPRAPSRAKDGTSFFAEIPWCSWPTDADFGDPGKYASGAGHDVR